MPAADAGTTLYVREKDGGGPRTLLYVHGATYAAENTFDLPLDGRSWMDAIAEKGVDVYLMDVRGYGRSTAPSDEGVPVVRTETAVRDLGAVVDFIRARRSGAAIDLLGWSWGTTICGWYATQHPEKVRRLALYAPQWLRTEPLGFDPGGALGAYRTVTPEASRRRWLRGVPDGAELIPAGWFEAFVEANFPDGVLRAPNGVLADDREHWSKGQPLYDPALIRAPTFLAHAAWDVDLPSAMLHGYLARLTCEKAAIELPEGTHTVMLERHREALFAAIEAFLSG